MSELTIPHSCIHRELGYVLLNKKDRKAYRYVTSACRDFLNSSAYQEKSGTWWPSVSEIAPESIGEQNNSNLFLFEVDYIDHVVYWPEMSFTDIKNSLLFLSDICIYLAKKNIGLQSHLWNITLQKGSPFLIDLGDFKKNCSPSLMIDTLESTLRDNCEQHHCPINPKHWISNWSVVSNLISQVKKSSASVVDQCKSFKGAIESIEISKGHHYWDSYPVQLDMPRDPSQIPAYAESHRPALCNFIKTHSPTTLTDIGCSRGLYSFYASCFGSSCIGIDYSQELISDANLRAAELNLESSFALIGLLNPQSYGLNKSYGIYKDRFKSDMVIVPAVIHHLHGLGVELDSIINIFTDLAHHYLAIEHIPYDTKGNPISLLQMKDLITKSGFKNIHTEDSLSLVEKAPPQPRTWIFATKN